MRTRRIRSYLKSLCLNVAVGHIQILRDNNVGNLAFVKFITGARLITEKGLPGTGVFEGGER